MPFRCPRGVAGKNSSCHLLCWLTTEQTQSTRADLLFSQSGHPKFYTTFPLSAPLPIGLGIVRPLWLNNYSGLSLHLFPALCILLSFSHTNSFSFRQFSPVSSWCLLASVLLKQQTSSLLAAQAISLLSCRVPGRQQAEYCDHGRVITSFHMQDAEAVGQESQVNFCSVPQLQAHFRWSIQIIACLGISRGNVRIFFFPKCIRLSYLHGLFWLKVPKLL